MIFFLLASIALCFGLLGFLLHAFYFSKAKLAESLVKELESLRGTLALKQGVMEAKEKEARDAGEEVVRSRAIIQSLSQQLREENGRVDALQRAAQRQDEEISRLHRAAAELRSALIEAHARQSAYEHSETRLYSGEDEHGQSAEDQGVPLWKDNLNNLLNMLEKMEKE